MTLYKQLSIASLLLVCLASAASSALEQSHWIEPMGFHALHASYHPPQGETLTNDPQYRAFETEKKKLPKDQREACIDFIHKVGKSRAWSLKDYTYVIKGLTFIPPEHRAEAVKYATKVADGYWGGYHFYRFLQRISKIPQPDWEQYARFVATLSW